MTDNGMSRNNDFVCSVTKRSGATYSSCNRPCRSLVITARCSSGDWLELRKSAAIPSSRSAVTWSCISAIRGDTTRPVPSLSMAGIW